MDLHSELFMVSSEICNHYDNLQNTATNYYCSILYLAFYLIVSNSLAPIMRVEATYPQNVIYNSDTLVNNVTL